MPTSPRLTEEELRNVLLLACHAPSGGNGQPWSFAWDGEILEIFFDPARTPRVADPGLRGTWMQVGIFLECLEIAASVQHFALETEIHMPHVEGKAFASVRFIKDGVPLSPLAATLADRYTDRRDYAGGDFTAPVFEELRADCVGTTANVYFAPIKKGEVIEYMIDGDLMLTNWPEFHADTWPFQRWSAEEALQKGDGVQFAASNYSYAMSRVIKALGDRPKAIAYLDDRGLLKRILGPGVRRRILSSAGMGLYTLRSPGYEALVPAGRVMMRGWLKTQAAGYSNHMHGGPALFVYFRTINCLPAQLPPRLPALLEHGARVLKYEFKYPDSEYPCLLWRVGRCPGPLPGAMRTHRRDLSEILRIKPVREARNGATV